MQIYKDNCEELLEYGLPVIPLNGKRPIPGDWSRFCEVLPDVDNVQYWMKEFPRANVGVCCGPISGILALDVDVEDEKLVSLVKSVFPPSCVEKRSKKGWTWFYKWNGERKQSIRYMGHTIIDVLGTGSQCMIPPSVHPDTGKPVSYLGRHLPDSLDDLFVLPEGIYQEFQNALHSLEGAVQVRGTPSGRNDTLKSIVGAMYLRGETPDKIVKEVIELDEKWFKHKGRLFTDKKEFRRVTDPYINALNFVTSIITSIGTSRVRDGKESRVVVGGDEQSSCVKEGFHSGSRPLFNEFSEYMIKTKNFVSSEGVAYIYNDGKYEMLSDLAVESMIRQITLRKVKPKDLLGFKKILMADAYRGSLEELADATDGFLNLANGSLRIKDRVLLPHSPDFFFTYKLDHNYDPTARCDKWLEYLLITFQTTPELVDMTGEIFGYCLQGGDPWLHKAFCPYGKGRNGKSTWIAILQSLIGQENFSTVKMTDLEADFSKVEMMGKLANILDESPKKIIDAESFKSMVGGGFVSASYKYKDVFKFKAKARMVFSANDLPRFADDSVGLIERLHFIPFRRYIPESERKANYHERFYPELSGILNWALVGLDRLVARGHMSRSQATDDVLDEFRQADDSVYYWFKNYVVETDDEHSKLSARDIYNHYRSNMIEDGKKPKNKDSFFKQFSSIACRVRNHDGVHYTNVQFKSTI